MNENRIKQVLEIEKKAQELHNQAASEAQQLPAQAEQEAQEIVNKARADAQEEARQIVAKAKAEDEVARNPDRGRGKEPPAGSHGHKQFRPCCRLHSRSCHW